MALVVGCDPDPRSRSPAPDPGKAHGPDPLRPPPPGAELGASFDPQATRHSLLSRIKDWEDQASWREFFDRYWRLIHATATRAGLRHEEAQEVVQETVLAVARNIGQFKTDPRRGSFKSWLLHSTRWKITDQFRKRARSQASLIGAGGPGFQDDARTGTGTAERLEDPAENPLEGVWDEEWEKSLLTTALERVRSRVKPEFFQIFHLLAVRRWPAREVVDRLRVNLAQVYYAQYKVGALVKREVRRLQQPSE